MACCKPRMRNAITRKLTENFIRYIKNKEKITGNLTSKKKAELGLPSNITIEVIKEYLGKEGFTKYLNEQDVWIVGSTGAGIKRDPTNKNEIVFIMQVTDVLSFMNYWEKEEYKEKKPETNCFKKDWENNNNSIKNCGDNIYEFDKSGAVIKMHPSFHYIENQFNSWEMVHDLSGEYVLLSDNYIYYGKNAIAYEGKIHEGRNHGVDKESDNPELANLIHRLFSNRPVQEIKGRPINSSNMFNID